MQARLGCRGLSVSLRSRFFCRALRWIGFLSKRTVLTCAVIAATNSKGEKEGFWGFDHIGQMIDHLGLERPQTDGWKAML